MVDDYTRALGRLSSLFLMEHASDAVILLDAAGTVLMANRPAVEILTRLDLVRILYDEAAHDPRYEQFHLDLRMTGRATTEIRDMSEPRRPRWLRVEGTAIDDHRLLVVRDVTISHFAREELRTLRRVEAAGLLALSIAHDLGNLLTPIQTLSARLADGRTAEGQETRETARDVAAAAQQAFQLVREMLAYMRRGAHGAERFNMNHRLREVRPLIEHLLGDGIDLVLSLDQNVGDCVVDREHFDHVVLNLAANARDAMPHGGRIVIATRNASVVPTLGQGAASKPHGPHVVLSVTDTGAGIAQEARSRVFERFFTTKNAGGTGLGLTSAKRFATEHGGDIVLDSEPGRGTTVTIYVPRAPVEEQTVAQSGRAGSQDPSTNGGGMLLAPCFAR